MIILRQKLFRRDVFSSSMKFQLDRNLINKYGYPTVYLEYHKDYNSDARRGGFDKKKVKLLISDIKNGYIYEDGPNGGDTHYLSTFSSQGKFLTFSKAVNEKDRLNYRIYPPAEFQDPSDKSKKYLQKIIILSCREHKIPGQGNYLTNKELRNMMANRDRRNTKK